MFNTILAGILGVAGLVVIYKQYNKLTSAYALSVYSLSGIVVVTLLGLVVGTTGGLTGIGGPALSVPALLILGVPIIQAVSAGIVQSVFMTASTGIRYALTGDIGLILLFTLATPFAVGILIGYRIAHKLDTNILRISLGVFLIIVSGIIALG
jgi:Sulfite exporter TauE/SafE.